MRLTTCGCCDPGAPPTPEQLWNRHGLAAIRYRVGTFASFREAMLRGIARHPELASLRTRESDDHAITLLEQWAVVADILTFYQERIANEAFLGTAVHRRSVLRLARLLDYQPRPGLAAAALLAFALDEGKRLTIPVGLRVQSVPGESETPQKYETVETFEARAGLNRLRPVPRPQPYRALAAGSASGDLVGGSAPSEGERLAFFGVAAGVTPQVEEKRVQGLESILGLTRVRWAPGVVRDRARCWRFTRKLRLFGLAAPRWHYEARSPGGGALEVTWHRVETSFERGSPANRLDLDAVYDDLAVGDRVLVRIEGGRPTAAAVRTVRAVTTAAAARGPLRDTVTRLTLSAPVLPGVRVDVRHVTVYVLAGDELFFWSRRYPERIGGGRVFLQGSPDDEEALDGRRVLVGDAEGPAIAAALATAGSRDLGGRPHLALDLDPPLTRPLATASAWLLGNVASATHGETVERETLGDGDAAAEFQRFDLKRKPLTYLPSAGPESAASSLEVFIDGVRWREVATLFGRGPADEVFTTRHAADGTTSVGFGGKRMGALPPTGRANIVARYRQGSGLAGRVGGGALRTLLDRPVGLKSVTNPLPAQGGADPPTSVRREAPTTVRTFGRAVSLADFEDLVKASGEVARARATWVWQGERRAVHLTVAAQRGGTFSLRALSRLHAGLGRRRDPNHPLLLDNYVRVAIVLRATILVDGRRVADEVEKAARAAVVDALSFERQDLGLPVHLSDVYAVLQGVDGVEAVDIDTLQFKDRSPAYLDERGATREPLQPRLRIFQARPAGGRPRPAEQAWVERPGRDLRLRVRGGLPG